MEELNEIDSIDELQRQNSDIRVDDEEKVVKFQNNTLLKLKRLQSVKEDIDETDRTPIRGINKPPLPPHKQQLSAIPSTQKVSRANTILLRRRRHKSLVLDGKHDKEIIRAAVS